MKEFMYRSISLMILSLTLLFCPDKIELPTDGADLNESYVPTEVTQSVQEN